MALEIRRFFAFCEVEGLEKNLGQATAQTLVLCYDSQKVSVFLFL